MKVITHRNQPTKLPILQTVLGWLVLDYYSAPQWLCGALGFFAVILWACAIYTLWKEKQVDIFKDNAETPLEKLTKSRFEERMEEAIKGKGG